MQLTLHNKAIIDAKIYEQLLHGQRYLPPGDPWFQDETGVYWLERMAKIREQAGDAMHTAASKSVGWDGP